MQLPAAIAIGFAALVAVSPPARAAEEEGSIAVLPFTSAKKRLEIYGAPVSRALAGELRGRTGARVEGITDPASLPHRIAWVIDGSIVERSGGKVVLEARLRDPEQGSAVGRVATDPRPLRQIDRLASELAGELLPLLEGARRSRATQIARRKAIRLPVKVVQGRAPAGAAPESRTLLVARTGGVVLKSQLDADPVATTQVADLAERLGYRPAVVELSGIAPPAAVQAALAGASARYALLTQVLVIEFVWRGVLTARGRLRVILVDASGKPLYDELIDTHTVVGSRGDRHEALVRFVARQAMDIAAPRLKKVLRR